MAPHLASGGNTEEALCQALERLDQLKATNAQLVEQVAALNQQLEDHSERLITPSTPTPVRDFPLPDADVQIPEPFSGKSVEYESFMAKCLLVFTVRPRTYATDERKVLFVVALLKDQPLQWARQIALDPDHELRNDWDAFKSAMDNIYQDRNIKWKRGLRLLTMKQTGSAEAYAAEFQSLASSLEINDAGLCLIFYNGLKSSVKDALAPVPLATKMPQLIDQAVGADQRVHQREVEEKRNSKTSPPIPAKSSYNSNGKRSFTNGTPPSSSTGNSNGNNSNLGNNKKFTSRYTLHPAEKKRRQDNNLCAYCASPKHAVESYPSIPESTSNSTGSANAVVILPSSDPPGKD